MEKLNQVHLIPANQRIPTYVNDILFKNTDGSLHFGKMQSDYSGHAQYIYFTSDEKIKEGEKAFLNGKILDESYQYQDIVTVLKYSKTEGCIVRNSHGREHAVDIRILKKITAATNKELWRPSASKVGHQHDYENNNKHFPAKISESFIDAYIKAYNEDPITEVVLKYEKVSDNADDFTIKNCKDIWYYRLKLNSAGEVEWKLKKEEVTIGKILMDKWNELTIISEHEKANNLLIAINSLGVTFLNKKFSDFN